MPKIVGKMLREHLLEIIRLSSPAVVQVWTLHSWFQTNPTKLNPLPLMLHPISPVIGTDGATNLSEIATMSPVPMHENTSDLQSDIQECVVDEHNVAES